ncbi:MAG TPA: EAL domain-containing protein [Candidatus Tumulicola sp.]|nr:EAL domain-containing protein [Candidatus Tumulicola sp.]
MRAPGARRVVKRGKRPPGLNADLLKRLSLREAELSALGQCAARLMDPDVTALPSESFEECLSSGGIVKAALFSRDEKGDSELLAQYGFANKAALIKSVHDAGLMQSISRVKIAKALRAKGKGPAQSVLRAASLDSALVVPLRIAEQLVGLLLAVPAKAIPAEHIALFAGAIAGQLSMAIGVLRARRELHLSEDKLSRIFECASEGLLFFTADRTIRQANSAAAAIAGVDLQRTIGVKGLPSTWKFFKITGEPMPPTEGILTRALSTGKATPHQEFIIQTPTRPRVIVSGAAAPVYDHSGKLNGVVVSITDMSDQRRAEERLGYLAVHDPLTDLPNRLLLRRSLEKAIALAARRSDHVALLFLDVDHFKSINDTMGHGAGDEVLVTLAGRLVSSVRQEDTVARSGGDEFIVVLSDAGSVDNITPAVERIMETCRQPFELGERKFQLSVSIGVSVYPFDGTDAETMLRNADAAMYKAKEIGRDTFRFFAQSMHSEALEHLEIEHDLRQALDRDELRLVFQPIVRSGTREFDSVEALLRWQHPRHGLLAPARFLGIAVDTGLIEPIGEWVLHQVCTTIREFESEGYLDLGMALNLSGRQFVQKDFTKRIKRIVDPTGINLSKLTFEITESEAMSKPEKTVEVVNELRAMGANVAIDDFGTGYSSLAYLTQYNASHLKLDRSFVKDIGTRMESNMIARAVIGLGHGLGMAVVGEGIELEEQATFLEQERCDLMQGYLFGRPVDRDQLSRVLQAQTSLQS